MFAIAQKQDQILPKIMTFVVSTVFLFACANMKLYILSITPVPITMHTFAILILGALLPFRMALGCFLLYFVEGIVGSPFLGVPLTFGPSFGYIVGMVVALYFLSLASKRFSLFASLVVADLIILAFGVMHLQFIVGLKSALFIGVLPFIFGNGVKLFGAYSFLQFLQKRRGKLNSSSI
jgi:biotin transport system substrate-specific component